MHRCLKNLTNKSSFFQPLWRPAFLLSRRVLAAFLVVGLFSGLLFVSSPASALSWKPLCVNGSNTQGAHNGTWSKLSSASAGGGTWKPVGSCAVPVTLYCPADYVFNTWVVHFNRDGNVCSMYTKYGLARQICWDMAAAGWPTLDRYPGTVFIIARFRPKRDKLLLRLVL